MKRIHIQRLSGSHYVMYYVLKIKRVKHISHVNIMSEIIGGYLNTREFI